MTEMAPMFAAEAEQARVRLEEWRTHLRRVFERVQLLALPTMPVFPPRLEDVTAETLVSVAIEITGHVALWNAAGTPATAQPIPVEGSALPASIELVGPHNSEELLLATAQVVESAAGV
jgi:Asp-tRNA(Asn)/Glu-tRNA(Gln) amidotransferase A subunit family amidase